MSPKLSATPLISISGGATRAGCYFEDATTRHTAHTQTHGQRHAQPTEPAARAADPAGQKALQLTRALDGVFRSPDIHLPAMHARLRVSMVGMLRAGTEVGGWGEGLGRRMRGNLLGLKWPGPHRTAREAGSTKKFGRAT